MNENLVELHDALDPRVCETTVVVVVGHQHFSFGLLGNVPAHLIVVVDEELDLQLLYEDGFRFLGQMHPGFGDAVPPQPFNGDTVDIVVAMTRAVGDESESILLVQCFQPCPLFLTQKRVQLAPEFRIAFDGVGTRFYRFLGEDRVFREIDAEQGFGGNGPCADFIFEEG